MSVNVISRHTTDYYGPSMHNQLPPLLSNPKERPTATTRTIDNSPAWLTECINSSLPSLSPNKKNSMMKWCLSRKKSILSYLVIYALVMVYCLKLGKCLYPWTMTCQIFSSSRYQQHQYDQLFMSLGFVYSNEHRQSFAPLIYYDAASGNHC